MRSPWLLGLTLTLVSCGEPTAEGAARTFCRELSAGRWEEALKVIGRDSEVKRGLAASPVGDQELLMTTLGASRCEVTEMRTETIASITFDAVDTPALMHDLSGQTRGAGPGGTAWAAQHVTSQIREGHAPRRTLVKIVPLWQEDGRWTATPLGLEILLDGMTGGLKGG